MRKAPGDDREHRGPAPPRPRPRAQAVHGLCRERLVRRDHACAKIPRSRRDPLPRAGDVRRLRPQARNDDARREGRHAGGDGPDRHVRRDLVERRDPILPRRARFGIPFSSRPTPCCRSRTSRARSTGRSGSSSISKGPRLLEGAARAAKAAGCPVLILTMDLHVEGTRYRTCVTALACHPSSPRPTSGASSRIRAGPSRCSIRKGGASELCRTR